MNDWIMHKKFDQSGQAIVEFVVVLPILMIVLMAIYFSGILIHNQQRAAMAARHGAWLIAHGIPENKVVNSPAFKKLFFSDKAVNEGRVTVSVSQPDRNFFDSEKISGLEEILEFVGVLLDGIAGARTVTVKYEAPNIPYISAFLPEAASNIQVSSHCTMVDVTNTWKSIWDILESVLEGLFATLKYHYDKDWEEEAVEVDEVTGTIQRSGASDGV